MRYLEEKSKIMPNGKVVVLTGAGISSESGLKTFRDNDGLWEGHRVEEVATPEAFQRNPKLVQKFYNLRRAQLKEVEPNVAHFALAEFEANHPGEFLIVTQNVDDLHERAGSKNIIHMHGELKKARCLDTGAVFDWTSDLDANTIHPCGGEVGRLRPHICWFGEEPFQMDEIFAATSEADYFVAIGTSGVVYPAAGLAQATSLNCVRVLLNMQDAENNGMYEEVILGAATNTVPNYFQVHS